MVKNFVIFLAIIFSGLIVDLHAHGTDLPPKKKFTVVLDAGHGGHDPGKNTRYYKEKDIALKIVLAAGKILEKNNDIEVIYTRKKDKFVDLVERGRIANKANADLFVSVHCNAHNSQAYGAETWVMGLHANKKNFEVAKAENSVIYLEENYEQKYGGFDPKDPESYISLLLTQEDYLDQSIQLAKIVQDGFTNSLRRKNRGVKQAAFIVLHQTVMPSVLIETGFITNKKEGAYLNSKKGQADMASSIAKAILQYRDVVQQNLEIEDAVEISSGEETNDEQASTRVATDVSFKVQIAASSRKLELKPYNFNGLNDISKEKFGKLYRYFYGNTSNYDEALQLKQKAREAGYDSAYLVAYKKGKKISVAEALQTP